MLDSTHIELPPARAQMKTRYVLSELFHYDPAEQKHSSLKKALKEYKFLLVVSLSALMHFRNGQYEKFDSLVGENACQIRAIKVALMSLEKNNDVIFWYSEQIKKILLRAQELLDESSMNRLMQKGYSLKQLIEEEHLNVSFDSDVMFLIQSFLLSEMKECGSDGELIPSILRKERCSPSAIQKKFPETVSYSFVEKLAKKIRPMLALSSVEFVREKALELNNPHLNKMVSEEFEIFHNNLACTPTFWTFKALFKALQKENIPFVFHVKFLSKLENGYRVVEEEFVYYQPDGNGHYETIPNDQDMQKAAIIVQGAVKAKPGQKLPSKEEWKESIRKFKPLEMLLAMGAEHRQYPEERPLEVDDPEYRHFLLMAKKEGFALKNPTTFFVQHIYCSQPIHLLSSDESTKEFSLDS